MNAEFHVIIPARYQSTRFPGKLLKELGGMSIIERVYRQVLVANPKSITIATDDKAIFDVAKTFGADVIMTKVGHPTGTDRLAEAAMSLGLCGDEIIVNVQGDEPFIDPKLVQQAAHSLSRSNAVMSTLCWSIDDAAMLHNLNVVKVVRDCHQRALYFSRSPIPLHRDDPHSLKHVYRHIGLYAYRARFLQEYVRMPVCELEAAEMLEQLRVLWAGFSILVEEACVAPLQDINTLEDLERAQVCLNRLSFA